MFSYRRADNPTRIRPFVFVTSALALALPLVSALTLNTPTGATTGGTITLSWTASTTDPAYFTFELVNTVFHNTFAIANNVQTSQGTLTIQLPQVPVGYVIFFQCCLSGGELTSASK
ncbi:hypothetical protein BS17DRAFT_791951 [Gyrodon lividus]|nr:hypothetical protein BS17DRAFT_791990 [Gyrodon lividus]KAF9218186.1 hypothetical protein BS17DRAFT_791951 [Gyrodon lividus]